MNYIISIARTILNIIYSLLKCFSVKNKILFLSRQSDNPSVDISMLADEIRKQHQEYEVIILCKKIGNGLYGKLTYCFHMLRQMYHLATSEVVILDSYSIAVSILKHRRSLFVIQMWHSVGTMKKFAYSILDKPEGTSSALAHAMHMHCNYDYILCAGAGYRSHLSEGFAYPEEKIVLLPLPRVELLQNKKYSNMIRQRIFESYPHLSQKKNILYVPTFRKDSSEKEDFTHAVNSLQNAFIPYSDEYNLIIKSHPLSGFNDNYDDFSSFEMLFVADYIISDYSCIIYEGAILHKPLFFYTYDYNSYTSKRDIYMDYPQEIPNDMYADPDELFNAIHNNLYDMNKQEAFLSRYVDYKRPHITSDIVQFIWKHKKEGND